MTITVAITVIYNDSDSDDDNDYGNDNVHKSIEPSWYWKDSAINWGMNEP